MKRKQQPTAEQYREQLRLAADEIIRLRGSMDGVVAVMWRAEAQLDDQLRSPWWVRAWARVKSWL